MYCDRLNLVTTGIGNLIDASARNSFDTSPAAMAPAMNLPWKFKAPGWTSKNPLAGGAASPGDIQAAWITTKLQEQNQPGFNKKGGFAYAGLTPLTLDMNGLLTLVSNKLTSNNATLVKNYPGFEALPADAQMGLLSMSWAMGASFWPALPIDGKVPHIPEFQAFKDAIDKLDFISAAIHSQFKGGGSITDAGQPGIRPASRNHDLDIMFRNAAASVKAGADPDQLFFPGTSVSGSGGLLSNPGIASTSIFSPTPGHIIGGAIVAGLFGFGLREYLKDRKPKRKS